MEIISSLQNQKIKNIVTLIEKSKERKSAGLFVVEGLKEVEMLYHSTYEIVEYYIHEKCTTLPDFIRQTKKPTYLVSEKVFDKISYRESTSAVVAVAQTKIHALADLLLSEKPLLIVLEGIEKPGNLGAVIRTADASGADAVIVCEPNTDIYNPNCIRNSVGTFFNKQIAVCTNEELQSFLKTHQIRSFATAITTDHYHYQSDYQQAVAFIFGTEATGLSNFWLTQADEIIKIPMLGKNDSLNVSNSVAICVYEAIRQRAL